MPAAWARLAMLLAATVIAGHQIGVASAQQRLDVVVPALLSIQASTEAALPIQIAPPAAVPRGCFIRLRGLPSTAALSDGHSIAPGAWAIPTTALPNLKLLVPVGASGRSEILITLLSADGSVLAEAKATLVVAPGPPPPGKVLEPKAALMRLPPAEAPSRESQAARPGLSPEAHERALRLVRKGDEQLADGGIAQARLLYERAAEAGLAQGAMSLAATYDPVELARLGARGLKPDRDEARRWYERARQLGASEAEERLRRLEAN